MPDGAVTAASRPSAVEAVGTPASPVCVVRTDEALLQRRSVVLVGPPGVGRSHALRLVAAHARTRGARVHELRATAAMASVPFGALLPMLAAQEEPPSGDDRTGTALALLELLLRDEGAILLLDDGHLLDGPSAGVVHQAATAGVPVVVAVRAGAPAPDAVTRLVADAGALLVTVDRLGEADIAPMLAGLLGGAVDDAFVHLVHGRTGGLPLAVAALAGLAVAAGAVREVAGYRRLVGPLPVSTELGALMQETVGGLDPAARHVAELIALAETLTDAELRGLGALAAAARAERAGALATGPSGATVLAHPLLVDALLADMPALLRRARLTELVEASGTPRSLLERVRAAGWALELGREVDAGELLALAAATAATQPDQAERFAVAAVSAGAGVPGRLRLAEILAHQHRAAEAEAVLARLDSSAIDASGTALTRAYLLVFALARPAAALEVLDGPSEVPVVAALRASALHGLGRTEEASALAATVVQREDAPVEVRAHAALTRAGALVLAGDREGFDAWLPVADDLVSRAVDAVPEGPEALRLIEALDAVRVRLDPGDGRRLAVAGYRRAVARGDDGERAQWAHLLAEAALLRGDPVDAVRLLRSAAGARGRWTTATVGMVRGALVRALALAGRLEDAAAQLDELRGLRVLPMMRVDVALAEAELAACSGDLRAAGALVAASLRRGDCRPVDVWYAGVRYGAAGAARGFLAATGTPAGAGRAAQRLHARAVLENDPDALEGAVAALAEADLHWYAIDAMAQVVRLRARRDPADTAPGERLRLLASTRPLLRSPAARPLGRPVLTEREAEIARMSVEGASARTVAAALQIGVRTVESHVAHVYRKLGVHSREDLRRALDLRPAPHRDGPLPSAGRPPT